MAPSAKPLRILAIVNLPWDPRLGASRVWIELAEEWIRAGHIVEKFCLTDAYPGRAASNAGSTLQQAFFPGRAAAYVRRHAARFDVIDCLIGTLPFTRRSLGFRGLLVARSVGLFRLYRKFLQDSRARWPAQPRGRFIGRIFHRLLDWHSWKSAETSIRCCDLLNLPNDGERLEIERDASVHAALLVQPYGLTDRFGEALERAAAPAAARVLRPRLSFIGTWDVRKGSRDWPAILQAVWRRHPAAEFAFLGTMLDEKLVRSALGCGDSSRVTCRSTYDPSELPALLAEATIGLFPSYIEGFGLAVIEQLAAGVPTIAYDVPGPRQILHPQRAFLLTPAGDPGAMAARASELLELDLAAYQELVKKSIETARHYRWEAIARGTANEYRRALNSLGRENPVSAGKSSMRSY